MPLSNNDTLRRLRYALNLNDPQLEKISLLAGLDLDREGLDRLMKKEGEDGYEPCPDSLLAAFLDGLILWRRGPKPGADPRGAAPSRRRLTNNDVLKKIRVALELREEDLIEIMRRAGVSASPSELNALFRQPDHRNYKECGDQFLRNFLTGLEGYRGTVR
jgi:uncharacterized protein YehS (DUF1456 family)